MFFTIEDVVDVEEGGTTAGDLELMWGNVVDKLVGKGALIAGSCTVQDEDSVDEGDPESSPPLCCAVVLPLSNRICCFWITLLGFGIFKRKGGPVFSTLSLTSADLTSGVLLAVDPPDPVVAEDCLISSESSTCSEVGK